MSRLDTWRPYQTPTDLYKGFADIIAASERLRVRGITVEVNLVGDGDAKDDLVRYAANFPKLRSVRFHGSLDDVQLAQQYRDAHVFVLPSAGEGFGLVYAEAMAAGLPCIAAHAGGAKEVVLDGEAGLLVPFGDPAALSDHLDCLLRNPTLFRRLSAGAQARHDALFSHPVTLRRWTNQLRSLGSPGSDQTSRR
ncbi:MAG TPA: glycosyltransferase [Opitutaceae bacterium]|nr:glycosyltransferase [Opitutaceae bacterium]